MPTEPAAQAPPKERLVAIGLVGNHPILCRADEGLRPCEVFVRDLGVSVNADGANGLTTASPLLARQLGVQSPDGGPMRLAAYHPDDWGPRPSWVPSGRRAFGLDAPEAGGEREEIEGGHHYSRAYGFVLDQDGQPYVQRAGDPALMSKVALMQTR